MRVQNRVKELRIERGLRQDELAKKLNVSQQTISRIETEGTSLAPETLVDLSNFFKVSIDYILYQTNYRKTYEFAIEFNRTLEEGYYLCQLYNRLNRAKQEILMKFIEAFVENPE